MRTGHDDKRLKFLYVNDNNRDTIYDLENKEILNFKEVENLLNEQDEIIQRFKEDGFGYNLINVTDLDTKLDYMVNFLFDLFAYVDVHYEEIIRYKIKEAEEAGFNVEPTKESWL